MIDLCKKHPIHASLLGATAAIFTILFLVLKSSYLRDLLPMIAFPIVLLILKLRKTEHGYRFDRDLNKGSWMPILYLVGLSIATIVFLAMATRMNQFTE